MPNALEIAGSRSVKQTRFAPIFINRPYGIYANINPLRDPTFMESSALPQSPRSIANHWCLVSGSSWNALDQEGGVIYLFSADGQFLSLDPSLGITRSGFPIADQIEGWNPANVYVACHESGNDNAAVGIESTRRRLPMAEACGARRRTSLAAARLCRVSKSAAACTSYSSALRTGGQTISKRDLTVFSDLGTPYQADFTVGSLVLAQPGQLAELAFITCDFVRTGMSPIMSFLLGISGSS
jgi:hypothetical protein